MTTLVGRGFAARSTAALAGHLRLHSRVRRPGHRFAQTVAFREMKSAAREVIYKRIAACKNYRRDFLMLTMPGLRWEFEHELLRRRRPGFTRFIAIERDEAIYRSALRYMPGYKLGFDLTAHTGEHGVGAATAVVSTPIVRHYIRTEFEHYAYRKTPKAVDAAWLDFNGQLTERRIAAIANLWPSVKGHLFLTFLNGRTPLGLNDLLCLLPEAEIRDDFTYYDSVSMRQVTLKRVSPPTPKKVA